MIRSFNIRNNFKKHGFIWKSQEIQWKYVAEFYEFDKFGGVSKGKVIADGKDIHYEYEYGDLTLRDSWIFIDKDQYTYVVASVKNGEQDQIYHQGVFVRQ